MSELTLHYAICALTLSLLFHTLHRNLRPPPGPLPAPVPALIHGILNPAATTLIAILLLQFGPFIEMPLPLVLLRYEFSRYILASFIVTHILIKNAERRQQKPAGPDRHWRVLLLGLANALLLGTFPLVGLGRSPWVPPDPDHVPVGSRAVRLIAVPAQIHIYSDFQTQVIASQAELDRYLTQRVRCDSGFQVNSAPKARFLDAVAAASIRFDRESLVIIRHAEGSGAFHANIDVEERDGVVRCRIRRREPGIGYGYTCDMKYYCWVLAVDRRTVRAVEVEEERRNSATVRTQLAIRR
jgi:hypothetical protein